MTIFNNKNYNIILRPYPINWDLYDIAMGRTPGDNKIELKEYLESDDYKNFFEKYKKPKK